MNLLIDMGNTRLKWAVATAGQLTAGSPLLNTEINRHELIDAWKGIGMPQRIAVSCVSASGLLELVQSVAFELWLDVDIIVATSQAQACGVINAYQQPEKLGVDRWLSLIAVWRQYRKPVCIVDCGTAITVDLIDADGRHQGGLISPGLTLMKKSLGQGTAALAFSEASHVFPPSPANFTEAAIYSGTLVAAIGLIEHVLSKQAANTQLILTGGDAELIAGQLDVAAIVDPDLVLRGLSCVLSE
ncbi:MAG: type III pantothenate kinase [Methylobacter sp.]|nr:MAG: type III pantothenate kinase [Methylobacter sp.]